uniref:Uncharacterized protein n=1 Tax=Setaria viridis TaxID=4556 RepID=A0A4U6UAA2_SETVI|nr:hypothetical protein SEVIR_5G050000v2 [Setaria viridis]
MEKKVVVLWRRVLCRRGEQHGERRASLWRKGPRRSVAQVEGCLGPVAERRVRQGTRVGGGGEQHLRRGAQPCGGELPAPRPHLVGEDRACASVDSLRRPRACHPCRAALAWAEVARVTLVCGGGRRTALVCGGGRPRCLGRGHRSPVPLSTRRRRAICEGRGRDAGEGGERFPPNTERDGSALREVVPQCAECRTVLEKDSSHEFQDHPNNRIRVHQYQFQILSFNIYIQMGCKAL